MSHYDVDCPVCGLLLFAASTGKWQKCDCEKEKDMSDHYQCKKCHEFLDRCVCDEKRKYPEHVYDNVVLGEEEGRSSQLGRYRVTYQVMRMVSLWASTDDEAIAHVNANWQWMDATTDNLGDPEILDIEEIVNSD
jgi:hypothetical protein